MARSATTIDGWVASHSRVLLLGAGGLVASLFALHVWLLSVGPLPGERALLAWFRHHQFTPLNHEIPTLFGALGSGSAAVVTVSVATWVVASRVGRGAALLVVASSGVVVFEVLLKSHFGPTPLMEQYRPGHPNFPSGHVAYATAVFGMLSWLAARHGQRELAIVLIAMIAAMGAAMVLNLDHFPSDLFAGYALGLAWLIVIVVIVAPQLSET